MAIAPQPFYSPTFPLSPSFPFSRRQTPSPHLHLSLDQAGVTAPGTGTKTGPLSSPSLPNVGFYLLESRAFPGYLSHESLPPFLRSHSLADMVTASLFQGPAPYTMAGRGEHLGRLPEPGSRKSRRNPMPPVQNSVCYGWARRTHEAGLVGVRPRTFYRGQCSACLCPASARGAVP